MSTNSEPLSKKPKVQHKISSFFTKVPPKVVGQNAESNPHESIQNDDLLEESQSNSDSLLGESQGISVSQKLSSSGQADTKGIPSCWTKPQYDLFTQKYPWIYCQNVAVGCKTCKTVSSF